MSRVHVRPFLILKNAEGSFHVTLRETRFNSQGYPLVKSTELPDRFPSATAARAYVREHYRAEAADIATK